MTAANPGRPEPGPDADIDDIEADIEQTRTELGETVQALQDKLDVKGRATDKATETKQAVVEKAAETKQAVVEKADTIKHAATDNPKRSVPVAAVVLIALAVGVLIWRRRR
ncbi:DUF3618 domain-containing protein [Mycobacterium deserti]|uniref:DUF3618 domain-containing protein n=1 Tax=Mycobacterium deserti TaxID=2978347 RepID=A0ABT2MF26_9MYCO|nr:DUF3618 domain-containing protein [Mycobacterium deserti]MCT7659596.1 DUF3618 domain-containing protein [Mycobacterium deserti]